ncbi:MAG: leucyl aminopeptidase [Flavobacteriales bacterium]|jgi:leucyl aminopeptidase
MQLTIKKVSKPDQKSNHIHLITAQKFPSGIDAQAKKAIKAGLDSGLKVVSFIDNGEVVRAYVCEEKSSSSAQKEALRNIGYHMLQDELRLKTKSATLINHTGSAKATLLVAEGFGLGHYQFLELYTDANKRRHSLSRLNVADADLKKSDLDDLTALVSSVNWSRDLINRPLSHLTAVDLANAITEKGKELGFSVEVLNRKKIESLKMGGLLSVNKGSIDPPTFTILEWKPKNAKNAKPIVLVGKGVVYDTGGMSLKPTANSMDFMKSDMGGAAAMVGTVAAAAAMKLPVHLVSLIPATDNRPDGNAYVPGDVITMFDGTTVEVKNTDAEGRLLLADALHYAKKYDPELVFDAATLTGAAVRAVGTYASAVMGTASSKVLAEVKKSGEETYERTVEFPLWDEYGAELKSTVADLSNLGKGEGGQISAGKFLQHFTDYPWVHIDIAGPAFLHTSQTYRPVGGTGVGVRLLIAFLKNHYKL